MFLNAQSDEGTSAERSTSKCMQYVSVLVATLAAFSIGTYLAWTSSALPLYKNTSLLISDQENSWISSLTPLGAIPAVIPAKMLADKIGRKTTIWSATVPLFFCWHIIGHIKSKTWICLARFVAGIGCGATSIVLPIFVFEIIEKSLKNWCSIVFQLQITAGILFAYATAFTNDLNTIAILCSVAPALLLIIFPFVPESPTWLVMQGRKDIAHRALKRFRGAYYCTEEELNRLELLVSEMRETSVGILDLNSRNAIVYGLIILQQLSGVCSLIFYASEIFGDADSVLSPTTSSVIVGVVQLIAAYFSIVMIERVGRKLLLFLSASVMATCMFFLSGYFHFQELHDVSNFSWMPLLLFAIYIMIFNVGFGLIPWLLIGELLTNDRRNDASTATVTCAWALAFLVTKCFQDMLNLMGPSLSFAFFGMMSLLGTVFISVLIPEREEGGHVEDEPQIELHDVRNRRETETLAIQM